MISKAHNASIIFYKHWAAHGLDAKIVSEDDHDGDTLEFQISNGDWADDEMRDNIWAAFEAAGKELDELGIENSTESPDGDEVFVVCYRDEE